MVEPRKLFILEQADTCRHFQQGQKVDIADCLVVQNGEGRDAYLILCPLCAKLVGEQVLSQLFTSTIEHVVKTEIKDKIRFQRY